MVRKIFILGLIISFAFSNITGREIMEKQKKLQSTNTEQSEELMLLIDEDGTKEKRGVRRYIKKDNQEDLTNNLIVFIYPADVRGVALLSKEISDTTENQWLYLPSLKTLKRIAQGSKKSYFMGTDFTYEDLSGDKLDNYKYKLLKEEPLKVTRSDKLEDCYVVEAIPTPQYAKNTMYSKKILWISKNHFYTKRIDFYDKNGELIKRETSWDFKNLGGTVYRPIKGMMNNFKEHHKTLVKVNKNYIYKKIPSKIFTERYLRNEEYMLDD